MNRDINISARFYPMNRLIENFVFDHNKYTTPIIIYYQTKKQINELYVKFETDEQEKKEIM